MKERGKRHTHTHTHTYTNIDTKKNQLIDYSVRHINCHYEREEKKEEK